MVVSVEYLALHNNRNSLLIMIKQIAKLEVSNLVLGYLICFV